MQEQRRARVQDLFAAPQPHLSAIAADHLFAFYECHYRAAWAPFPDVLPALAALNECSLAVLSNGDLTQQTQKLRSCGLATYFAEIMTSSEIGSAKPAPETFLLACQRLGFPARYCAYVGDSLDIDAHASAAAGLTSIWLNRKASNAYPDPNIQVIRSLLQLPALIGAPPGPDG